MKPLVLGDLAFQFSTWLMKPYTNARLPKEQGCFNYQQNRAQMVVEGVYGQLKGRWWVLKSHKETVK